MSLMAKQDYYKSKPGFDTARRRICKEYRRVSGENDLILPFIIW